MTSPHATHPFQVAHGRDTFLGTHTVHLGYGIQRWALTTEQARDLARDLAAAARDLAHTPRSHVGIEG